MTMVSVLCKMKDTTAFSLCEGGNALFYSGRCPHPQLSIPEF